MRVVVAGASGHMGSAVADALSERGHDVVRASRRTGVDVLTGSGVSQAVAGADCIVDCLNKVALSRRSAVGFFGAAARQLTAAAARESVPHVVVLSILNVTTPVARAGLGYYEGKAVHEETYLRAQTPATVVATAAWFTLAEEMLSMSRVGPLSFVPMTRVQPVHPRAARDAVVEAVEAGPAGPRIELAGPQPQRADQMAAAYADAIGEKVRVVPIPFPSKAFREGAMLPGPAIRVDERRFEDWLRDEALTHRRLT